jgi:hypothetical protein
MGFGEGVVPLDVVKFDDPAVSAGAAGMQTRINIPIFSSFGQFSVYILAFGKQCFRTASYPRLGKADELM